MRNLRATRRNGALALLLLLVGSLLPLSLAQSSGSAPQLDTSGLPESDRAPGQAAPEGPPSASAPAPGQVPAQNSSQTGSSEPTVVTTATSPLDETAGAESAPGGGLAGPPPANATDGSSSTSDTTIIHHDSSLTNGTAVIQLQPEAEKPDTKLIACGHSPGVLKMSVMDAWDTGAVLDFRVLNLATGQAAGTRVRMLLPDGCQREERTGYNIEIAEFDGGYVEIVTTIRQHGFGFSVIKDRTKDPRDCFPSFLGLDGARCNDCDGAGITSHVRPGELWESRFGMTSAIGGVERIPAYASVTFELPDGCGFSDGWNAQYSTDGKWVTAVLDFEGAELDMIIDKPWNSDPILCFPYDATVHC